MIKYKTLMLEALNNYLMGEWWDPIDEFPEDGIFPLGWTDYYFGDDKKHNIEIKLDLNELCYLTYIDGKMYPKEPIDSIDQLLKDLKHHFDDILNNRLKKLSNIHRDKKWENVSLYQPKEWIYGQRTRTKASWSIEWVL